MTASTSFASTLSPSSSTYARAVEWNPLQRGVAHWLEISSDDDDLTAGAVDAWGPTNTVASSSALLASSSSSPPDRSPTKDEIALLQKAFASFYGQERNAPRAYELLSECIAVWEGTKQGGDEIAGLYRVRGDVDMDLFRSKDAEKDYAKAIQYLEGPDGYLADPEEFPAARLGRARAVRSQGSAATTAQAIQASNDYEIYFGSISEEELEEDGAASGTGSDTPSISTAVVGGIQRNPYAAWEWGMVDRVARNYDRAAEVHRLASVAFAEIGDKPRSVICALDRGLDLASGLDGGNDKQRFATAKRALEEAIESDVNVEGRDVRLLQRVVAKEGEARVALAGVLWEESGRRGEAESQYGTACARLEELGTDYRAREEERVRAGRAEEVQPRGATLGFSMEDIVGAEEAGCSRFGSERFVEERLVWNEGLRAKVKKFLTLSR